MRTDLIIFDCDGVLVDSEPISIAVLRETISRAGGTIEEETAYRHFLGRNMASIREILRTDFNVVINDNHLQAIREELNRRFEHELRPIPGVGEFLDHLDTPHCVASSSQPARIRLSLGVTGLLHHFEPHIYSATMVERGKPAPDLFLHAATAMGAAPARSVVIEDSPAGVAAAKKAGMHVFAFSGGTHARGGRLAAAIEALHPDAVFDDMRQLPGLLTRLGNCADARSEPKVL